MNQKVRKLLEDMIRSSQLVSSASFHVELAEDDDGGAWFEPWVSVTFGNGGVWRYGKRGGEDPKLLEYSELDPVWEELHAVADGAAPYDIGMRGALDAIIAAGECVYDGDEWGIGREALADDRA